MPEAGLYVGHGSQEKRVYFKFLPCLQYNGRVIGFAAQITDHAFELSKLNISDLIPTRRCGAGRDGCRLCSGGHDFGSCLGCISRHGHYTGQRKTEYPLAYHP
jgi:hypothetical protein